MDLIKLISASISIAAGCIGIWIDFSKKENKKWGIALMLIIISGGFVSYTVSIDQVRPSPTVQNSNIQKKDSLLLLESRKQIAQYDQILKKYVSQMEQTIDVDQKVRQTLQLSKEVSNSNADMLTNIKSLYAEEKSILASNQKMSKLQSEQLFRSFNQIDSVTENAKALTSNLIVLENQLLLPIDHIDVYLRLNHRLDKKIYDYYKLRNHFSPDTYASLKGNLRIDHQAPNDPKSSEDFLDLEHAYFNITDSSDQVDLIHQDSGFGLVLFDDIYLFSNETEDSIVARIDYQLRITPESTENKEVFVRSLRNGHGHLKIAVNASDRSIFDYTYESVYLRIHSGNKETGLHVGKITHRVDQSDGKTFDLLEFRLGKDIFDHALINNADR